MINFDVLLQVGLPTTQLPDNAASGTEEHRGDGHKPHKTMLQVLFSPLSIFHRAGAATSAAAAAHLSSSGSGAAPLAAAGADSGQEGDAGESESEGGQHERHAGGEDDDVQHGATASHADAVSSRHHHHHHAPPPPAHQQQHHHPHTAHHCHPPPPEVPEAAESELDEEEEGDEDDDEYTEFDPLLFIKTLPPLEQCIPKYRQVALMLYCRWRWLYCCLGSCMGAPLAHPTCPPPRTFPAPVPLRNPPVLFPCQVLLPRQTRQCKLKTLVLDLDETLVHSSLEHAANPDFSFDVRFNNQVQCNGVRRGWGG